MRPSIQAGVPVWNRQAGRHSHEPVYRGGSLDFLFHHPLGRFLMRHVLPCRLVNNLITWRQRSRLSRREIQPFIDFYGIDTSEFRQPVESFQTFAEFFVRDLREGARPVSAEPDGLVSPCDGRIEWENVLPRADTGFEVKGRHFTLSSIFSDTALADRFLGGTVLGLYLAPFDYHRFCYPWHGQVRQNRRIGNRYYSVNEESISAGFRAYDANIRQYTILEDSGTVWGMVEVAGLYAGRIVDLDDPEAEKRKGAMKGFFDIGGSFILLVFPHGAMELDPDIRNQLSAGIPVRVKQGEKIGTMLNRESAS